MGRRRWFWQTNISPYGIQTCHVSHQTGNELQLFGLSLGLFILLSFSWWNRPFSSITFVFIPFICLVFVIRLEWSKYFHIVYKACFSTYRALSDGDGGGGGGAIYFWVCCCLVVLMINILSSSHIADRSLLYCLDLCFIHQKDSLCVRGKG